MFKYKNENKLENFLQRKGGKHTSEKILKESIKILQKTDKKNSIDAVANSLVTLAGAVEFIEQTLKKGKRKKKIQKTLLLVSENARFSKACLNLVTSAKVGGKKKFSENMAFAIRLTSETDSAKRFDTEFPVELGQKTYLKFRW